MDARHGIAGRINIQSRHLSSPHLVLRKVRPDLRHACRTWCCERAATALTAVRFCSMPAAPAIRESVSGPHSKS